MPLDGDGAAVIFRIGGAIGAFFSKKKAKSVLWYLCCAILSLERGKSLCRKDKNMETKVMVCACRFNKNGMLYHYRCEDISVMPGDRVIVRVGAEGRVKAASVVSVLFCTAEDAPYPLDEMKTIVKRVEPTAQPPAPKSLSQEEIAERKKREEEAETLEEAFGIVLLVLFAPFALLLALLAGFGKLRGVSAHPGMRDNW